jgi:rhodanese-related sulfurtransferase
MPKTIDRDEVQCLTRQGAQLVEVLPRKQYRELHLPSAINIPLHSLDQKSVAALPKDNPVIVYCYDYQ